MTYEAARIISNLCAFAVLPCLFSGVWMAWGPGYRSDKWAKRGVSVVFGAFVLLYVGDPQFGPLSGILQAGGD